MPKQSQEEVLKGIQKEIIASSVLFPKSDADHAWNNANRRAKDIIQMYIKGNGLFQLTEKTRGKRKKYV